jgi:predicted nucleotidyltransferase component of viral defense system
MIDVAEVKRMAGLLGLNPIVIEHDYVLGCYLHYLGEERFIRNRWMFKGGTALRKCYFENFRFSEDLDFTLLPITSIDDIKKCLEKIQNKMQNEIGIRTDIRKMSIVVIEDEYGKESFEIKVYYSGPWDYGGSLRTLRLHINHDEKVVFPARTMKIFHPYSDKDDLPKSSITAYSLEEGLSEKLRAVSGQRRYAIARDLYDIHFISGQMVDVENSISALPQKFTAKGIDIRTIRMDQFLNRKDEYKTNWERNLNYLIPSTMMLNFEEAWESTFNLLKIVFEKYSNI